MTTNLLDSNQKAVLARLESNVAAGASFDSRDEARNPLCLPNTRVELLEQILEWAVDSSAEAIFWLNGMAGTGKSTISRTIAHTFARRNLLGASFFFKRGETDRGDMVKFFSTIAADLARRESTIAHHLKNVIESDSSIFRKAMNEQFNELICEPLLAIQRTEPLVVVVDALDECDREDDIRLMIRLFSQARTLQSQSVRLKVLLTSRPELPIRLEFRTIEGNYHGLILHAIPQSVIEHDISAFLEHELAKIRGEYNASVADHRQLALAWPSQSNVHTLVNMAIPLFIFAATMCRFIADRRIGPPDKQLKKVLEPKAGN
jgi:hypothetical protein